MSKNKIKDFLKFMAFVLCFAGIPLTMVIIGYLYDLNIHKEAFIKGLSRDISAFYTKLTPFADQQKFWYYLFSNKLIDRSTEHINNYSAIKWISRNFNRFYLKQLPNKVTIFYTRLAFFNNFKPILAIIYPERKKVEQVSQLIVDIVFKNLNKDYDFDYLVYNPNIPIKGKMASDTLGGSIIEQKMALRLLWKFKVDQSSDFTSAEEAILGKVFGPQFCLDQLDLSESYTEGWQLTWPDSIYKRRLIWNSKSLNLLELAFIKTENITNIDCIKTYLDTTNEDLKYDLNFSIKNESENSFLYSKNFNEKEREEIASASIIYEKNRSMLIETENYYVFPKFLRAGATVYGAYKKTKIEKLNSSIFWFIGIFFTLLTAIYLCVYSWKVIIQKKLDNISIKWKLIFLFFFANGLPLLVLIFLGNNYLRQARSDYIQKIMTEGTAFLHDFDEKYDLEYARGIIRKEKFKKDIAIKRKDSVLIEDDVERLYQEISSHTWALFVIASSGKTLVRNDDGIYDDSDIGKTHVKKSKIKKVNKDLDSQIEFAQKLGNFIINQLNNKPIKEKNATEIELIVESALRKSLSSFIFELIGKFGNFIPMGFGKNVHPTLIDTIGLHGENHHDYFIFATIRTRDFQKSYLEAAVPQANRNELKLKVISWNNENGFIPGFENTDSLDEFRKRLTAFPVEEAVIINHQDVDYIAMGFECKRLERCKLIGLYPLSLIDEHVALRRKGLIVISLLSILMTMFLSSIIIKSFLTPLSEIHSGAKSIEEKNFEYRLPELGRDEFGDMGRIFNNVIVDLEELSVAGAIQEQLLPSSPIKTGYFSLYGKSVPMGALGGDYFDFIEMEDNKFSVALGDVAGHGVGASLIMAMAKAGLITLDTLWTEPQKLILRLHEMIYKSKTQKQRKIMTFQYMYLDGNSGQASYSNAGGCSPIIIRKSSNTADNIKLNGAVLGAFKKGKFTETTVQFEPGDAIVFYTDGIVECKDSNGTMLGYDNLRNMILQCWDSDAEVFYKRIYENYLNYIGGDESQAGDDVTIVVLVFNKPLDSSENNE